MYRDRNFERSEPRRAKGGIKSRSKKGAFGESWWAKRWIGALERMRIGSRLNKGRSYARGGQVLSIDIDRGLATARVQGSRKTPYTVTIEVKTLSAEQWDTLAGALSGQAIFAARLLAGEMPHDIEEVFQKAGIPFFPDNARDLHTDCTCPDWSNPCKHIAAVYYLLGEEFDRDPFLMFRLRGIEREALMAKLTPDAPLTESTPAAGARSALPPEELRPDPDVFWGTAAHADAEPAELRTPPVSAALPRQLGAFPFWRAETPLHEMLAPLYREVSEGVLRSVGEGAGEGQEE